MNLKNVLIGSILSLLIIASFCLNAYADPIHKAAIRGDLIAIQQELDNGVNVNCVDQNGCTALICASWMGYIHIVEKLLQTPEIKVNKADQYECTALIWGVINNRTNIVRMLLQTKDINVNLASKSGATPLFWAAFYGHIDIVKILLQAPGINVLAENKDGKTALDLAATKEVKQLIKEHINKRFKNTKSAKRILTN